MEPVNIQLLISTGGVLISGIAATLATGYSSRKTIQLEHKKAHETWLRETTREDERTVREAYRQLLIDIDDFDLILSTGFLRYPAYVDPRTVEAAERKLKAQVATVLVLIADDSLEEAIRAVSARLSLTRLRTVEAMMRSEDVDGLLPQQHKFEMDKLTKEILKAFQKDL